MNDDFNDIPEWLRDHWINGNAQQKLYSERYGSTVSPELGTGGICDPTVNVPNQPADSSCLDTELGKWDKNSRAAIPDTSPGSSVANHHHLGAMMKFEFTEQMVMVIGEALSQLPYRISAPVIAEFQKQLDAQNKGRERPLK